MQPFIGVTCSADDDGHPVIRPQYVTAVHAAGGLPVALPFLDSVADAHAILDRLDGVLLTGSEDLDSSLWGESQHPQADLMHPARQRTELALCRAILEWPVPTLAICGGMQNLAVAAGGAIHQHIPDAFDGSIDHSAGPEGARHEIETQADSTLASMLGPKLVVNSAHHQSIARLPDALKPVAWSGDGVLEAFEGSQPTFVVGVQWHPERMLDEPLQRQLFTSLVQAAAS